MKTFEEFEDIVISVQCSADFTYLTAVRMDGRVIMLDGFTNEKLYLF